MLKPAIHYSNIESPQVAGNDSSLLDHQGRKSQPPLFLPFLLAQYFLTGLVKAEVSGRRVDGSSDTAFAALLRGFAPAVRVRA